MNTSCGIAPLTKGRPRPRVQLDHLFQKREVRHALRHSCRFTMIAFHERPTENSWDSKQSRQTDLTMHCGWCRGAFDCVSYFCTNASTAMFWTVFVSLSFAHRCTKIGDGTLHCCSHRADPVDQIQMLDVYPVPKNSCIHESTECESVCVQSPAGQIATEPSVLQPGMPCTSETFDKCEVSGLDGMGVCARVEDDLTCCGASPTTFAKCTGDGCGRGSGYCTDGANGAPCKRTTNGTNRYCADGLECRNGLTCEPTTDLVLPPSFSPLSSNPRPPLPPPLPSLPRIIPTGSPCEAENATMCEIPGHNRVDGVCAFVSTHHVCCGNTSKGYAQCSGSGCGRANGYCAHGTHGAPCFGDSSYCNRAQGYRCYENICRLSRSEVSPPMSSIDQYPCRYENDSDQRWMCCHDSTSATDPVCTADHANLTPCGSETVFQSSPAPGCYWTGSCPIACSETNPPPPPPPTRRPPEPPPTRRPPELPPLAAPKSAPDHTCHDCAPSPNSRTDASLWIGESGVGNGAMCRFSVDNDDKWHCCRDPESAKTRVCVFPVENITRCRSAQGMQPSRWPGCYWDGYCACDTLPNRTSATNSSDPLVAAVRTVLTSQQMYDYFDTRFIQIEHGMSLSLFVLSGCIILFIGLAAVVLILLSTRRFDHGPKPLPTANVELSVPTHRHIDLSN